MNAGRKTHVIPSLSRDRHGLPYCDNRAIAVAGNMIALPRQARDDNRIAARQPFDRLRTSARDDSGMRRRELMALVGSALVAYPSVAGAQPTSGMRRVAVLMQASESSDSPLVAAFRQGLAALGWTERRNLTLDVRYGNYARNLPALASELVARKPEAILAFPSVSVIALRPVAGAIPIVFVNVTDPVGQGFVRDLARPGGTITGFANYDYPMAGKWFQLLREVAPHVKRAAILYGRNSPSWPGFVHSIQATARGASFETVAIRFEKAGDISRVRALGANPPTGLILLPGAGLPQRQDALIDTAATLGLPVVAGQQGFTTRGGLMSYIYDVAADMRRAAGYVDRILRGENAGDLPVQTPDRFVLSINLKTAKQLGLVVPQSLLVSANELIR